MPQCPPRLGPRTYVLRTRVPLVGVRPVASSAVPPRPGTHDPFLRTNPAPAACRAQSSERLCPQSPTPLLGPTLGAPRATLLTWPKRISHSVRSSALSAYS